MTMFPAQTLSNHRQQRQQQQESLQFFHPSYYSRCGGSYIYNYNTGLMSRLEVYDYSTTIGEPCIGGGSNQVVAATINNNNVNPMAEDESRTNSLNEAGSSSKETPKEETDHDDQGWLQLSIGSSVHTRSNHEAKSDHRRVDPTGPGRRSSGGELVELDLLQGGSGNTSYHPRSSFAIPAAPNIFHLPPRPSFSTSIFFQPGSSSIYPPPPPPPPPFHHQEINWAFRPLLHNIPAAPSSSSSSPSSSSSLLPIGTYFSSPFQLHGGRLDVPSPWSDFRVIDPPRRPISSIWFMLQASQKQAKEPFLPQISKSYLRIKDGRMTIRLLMRYLVNKLRLDSESEIEITCRGQRLPPSLTLQHVRDSIWSPREDAVTLLPDFSTTDHIMVLHYGRCA